jgi:hypothetical protein
MASQKGMGFSAAVAGVHLSTLVNHETKPDTKGRPCSVVKEMVKCVTMHVMFPCTCRKSENHLDLGHISRIC